MRTKLPFINLKDRLFCRMLRNMKETGRAIIFALMGAFLLPCAASAENNSAPEFLMFGMPMSERADKLGAREFHRYVAALAEFRHVEDCVTNTEGGTRYESSLMRWNHLNTLEKVNVCIFLLAAELNDHEQMLSWFNSNGFEAILMDQQPSVMRFYNRDGEGILVSAGAPISDPIRVGLIDRLLAYGVSVGVVFASDGEPLNVNTTITRQ